jgi:hypothetical protein
MASGRNGPAGRGGWRRCWWWRWWRRRRSSRHGCRARGRGGRASPGWPRGGSGSSPERATSSWPMPPSRRVMSVIVLVPCGQPPGVSHPRTPVGYLGKRKRSFNRIVQVASWKTSARRRGEPGFVLGYVKAAGVSLSRSKDAEELALAVPDGRGRVRISSRNRRCGPEGLHVRDVLDLAGAGGGTADAARERDDKAAVAALVGADLQKFRARRRGRSRSSRRRGGRGGSRRPRWP